jgi:hypothetical protein
MDIVKSGPQPSLFSSTLSFLVTSLVASLSSAIILAGIVLLLSAVN